VQGLNEAVAGALTMGCFVIGVFFLRFWRATRDRLFAMFALAFWLLAGDWLGLALTRMRPEAQTPLYLVRLIAFVLIIVAIVDKNRTVRGQADRQRGPRRAA
jgi:uncharacterized protein DUF5985